MKKVIVLVLSFSILVCAYCYGTYARKVGEIKVNYTSKECIYETNGKRYSLLWGAYDQCPNSIEVDYNGKICKVD